MKGKARTLGNVDRARFGNYRDMSEINTSRSFNQHNLSKRGTPPHASAQRDIVLRLLREAKARGQGLRRDDAIFAHRITQVGTRIFELEKMGFIIRHEQEPGARFITYFLLSEPDQPKKLPNYEPKGPDPRQGTLSGSSDWYERSHGQRPSSHPWKRAFSKNRLADADCFQLTSPTVSTATAP